MSEEKRKKNEQRASVRGVSNYSTEPTNDHTSMADNTEPRNLRSGRCSCDEKMIGSYSRDFILMYHLRLQMFPYAVRGV